MDARPRGDRANAARTRACTRVRPTGIGSPSSARSASSCAAVMVYAPEGDFEAAMRKRRIARSTRGVDVPSIAGHRGRRVGVHIVMVVGWITKRCTESRRQPATTMARMWHPGPRTRTPTRRSTTCRARAASSSWRPCRGFRRHGRRPAAATAARRGRRDMWGPSCHHHTWDKRPKLRLARDRDALCHLVSVVDATGQVRMWPLWWHLSKAWHGPALLGHAARPRCSKRAVHAKSA